MRRIFVLFFVILAGACSMGSVIEAMTSPEDRAFAQEMVQRLRGGDEAWLQRHFDPELWAQSGKQLASVPGLFPDVPGTTEITSYSFSSSNNGGAVERTRQFTLVTHGEGRWTVTSFRTYSTGGPDRVVQWSVQPHDSPPAAMTAMKALPWIMGAAVAILLLFALLIFWLVRRSRRKHAGAVQGRGIS
jgi:hypothetical protein